MVSGEGTLDGTYALEQGLADAHVLLSPNATDPSTSAALYEGACFSRDATTLPRRGQELW